MWRLICKLIFYFELHLFWHIEKKKASYNFNIEYICQTIKSFMLTNIMNLEFSRTLKDMFVFGIEDEILHDICQICKNYERLKMCLIL
jgi:hypothetical protein